MKVACLFVLLPLAAFAMPEKRFLEFTSLLSSGSLTKYLNQIVDMVGSDASEAQCETACTEVITDPTFVTSCPFLCTSLQTLVNTFHITGDTTTTQHKRFLDILSSGSLAKYVNQIVDLVGSDATEQQCETACTEVITDALAVNLCPFICTSFQSLVNNLHLNSGSSQVQKRFLDILSSSTMAKYINQIVDLVGSDATEAQCETACTEVIHDQTFATACPFICTQFQTVVNGLHIGQVSQQQAKRFLIDPSTFSIGTLMQVFGSAELTKYVNQIVDIVGSDATEAQCETACVEVSSSDLFDKACPFICSSLQTLVKQLHIEATMAPVQ